MIEAAEPNTTFAVRVKGDSMRHDHVCDGDYLIVRRGRPAQTGEVVLATVGHGSEAPLPRGRIGRFFPAPASGLFLESVVTRERVWFDSSDVHIEGVVAGVIRRFGGAEW